MRITLTGIMVEDQGKALDFYTSKLGFIKKEDIPMGEYRWLTVVSPEDPDGVELSLEPNAHKAAPGFMQALKQDGIPFASFEVSDLDSEYQRLRALDVKFTQEPFEAGSVKVATLDDCNGNLIQLMQRL